MKYILSLSLLVVLTWFTVAFTPSDELLYVLEEQADILEQRIAQEWVLRTKILRAIQQMKEKAAASNYREIEQGKFEFVLWFFKEKVAATEKKNLTRNDFAKAYAWFEIMEYPETIVATVINTWPLWQTNDDSFENLADFIFWNNSASTEIAMTSPVTRTQLTPSTYETAFIMPSWRTLNSLPSPNNDRITIRTLPWSLKAVRKFSWRATRQQVENERISFQQDLTAQSVVRYWLPTLSQYDWPRVPAASRRNELWVELSE